MPPILKRSQSSFSLPTYLPQWGGAFAYHPNASTPKVFASGHTGLHQGYGGNRAGGLIPGLACHAIAQRRRVLVNLGNVSLITKRPLLTELRSATASGSVNMSSGFHSCRQTAFDSRLKLGQFSFSQQARPPRQWHPPDRHAHLQPDGRRFSQPSKPSTINYQPSRDFGYASHFN
jgi:hypothetical protein